MDEHRQIRRRALTQWRIRRAIERRDHRLVVLALKGVGAVALAKLAAWLLERW